MSIFGGLLDVGRILKWAPKAVALVQDLEKDEPAIAATVKQAVADLEADRWPNVGAMLRDLMKDCPPILAAVEQAVADVKADLAK